MFAKLSDIIKIPAALLTGMAVSALVLIVAYEGISLPLVGQVVNGRVANAVDAAKEKMVAKAEYDALTAVLARERENAARMNALAGRAEERARDAEMAAAEKERRIEEMVGEAQGLPTWSEEELEWLKQQ